MGKALPFGAGLWQGSGQLDNLQVLPGIDVYGSATGPNADSNGRATGNSYTRRGYLPDFPHRRLDRLSREIIQTSG
jgi:hypothetical protein